MGVTSAKGFVASGVACGIKPSGDLDLALVATTDGRPVPAAGVFTSNKATAAPVLVSGDHLAATGGQAAAVILNSGNANACTGGPGRANAERMSELVADELGCDQAHVLVCSTGLIGIPLPMPALERGIPTVTAALSTEGTAAAEAIRTTDTVRKEVAVDAGGFVVGGMAKGAAMLAPNMATMLAVLTTDAAVDARELHAALAAGVESSFNALLVDGATSTNDTVLLLASGASGTRDDDALAAAVASACAGLARAMATDAEGATKLVEVRVTGAVSQSDARRAAKAVAGSLLCKCSWYGCDPYWGRVVSELGSSGAAFDPDAVSVSYGDVTVCRGGVGAPHDALALQETMGARELLVAADLGLGSGSASVLTCDLTHGYVDENKGTS